MNKVTLLLSVAAMALVSCGKEEKPRYDPNATIWINGRDASVSNKTADGKQRKLTAAEVCAGDSLHLVGWLDNAGADGGTFMLSPTQPAYREIDTENNRLPMLAGNIDILEDNMFLDAERKWIIHKLLPDLMEGDTVAYVPTSNRLAAAEALRPLFDPANGGRDANLDAIYKIFNEAFIFVPCTGEEYKELKARGEN